MEFIFLRLEFIFPRLEFFLWQSFVNFASVTRHTYPSRRNRLQFSQIDKM